MYTVYIYTIFRHTHTYHIGIPLRLRNLPTQTPQALDPLVEDQAGDSINGGSSKMDYAMILIMRTPKTRAPNLWKLPSHNHDSRSEPWVSAE